MKKAIFITLMFVLLLALPAIAAAQEPAADAPQVIVEQPENQVNLLIAIVMSVLPLLGVLVGGGGVYLFVQRASGDKALKDSTEELLFKSTPPQTIELMHRLSQGAGQVARFIEDVTDGLDNRVRGFSVDYDLPEGADPAEAQAIIQAALDAKYKAA